MSTAQSTVSGTQEQPASHPSVAFIAFAWALVGVPLAYGLYNTVQAATALFTGG